MIRPRLPFGHLQAMSTSSIFSVIDGGSLVGVDEDSDAQSSAHIRDPVPMLPDNVGFLLEDQLQSLISKHHAANSLDEDAITKYLSKADSLRAELSACEAKVKQHMTSLQRGRDVVSNLY